MSHSLVPVPLLSCPRCSSNEVNTIPRSYQFMFSGICLLCDNNCSSTKRLSFYQCVCCPPFNTRAATVGFDPQFSKTHKDSLAHEKYTRLCTQSTQLGSLSMDTDPNDDVNLNNVHQVEDFDKLSLNLSTLSHKIDNGIEITSVLHNRVECIVMFLPIFEFKEQLDLSLQGEIGEPTKKRYYFYLWQAISRLLWSCY